MKKVAVIGAGSWGTALTLPLAENCLQVDLWVRRLELCRFIQDTGINEDYLPGVKLPANVTVTSDLEAAIRGKDALVLVVPSHTVRTMARQIVPYLKKDTIVINCAKGVEEDTLQRISEILQEELPHCLPAVLSGPNHAEEVGRLIPSATVVSAHTRAVAEIAQDLFMTSFFRVYTNPDFLGVEISGALKNVIALGAGISDGLGFGDNTKAALMTRGLTEIARLGLKVGANPLTFAGLAGIGDLMVTCTSKHSRNRNLGIELGIGRKLDEILAEMRMVAEGVRTTRAAWQLAELHGVEMPITQQVYEVLFKQKNPRQAVEDLMRRGRRHEMEEIVSDKFQAW
ncbi:MAG: NAD(P)H-dependent glycerol-3-phosphate dehydrogenase [Firmicutes bacterium]|jgi:glycerol-3-phosphate dehydrogenase (NAD(P)+)|nr:NAD(P)H-dependent glycerol-3-phosphate dehydrogenase [Dethiobacter sp.]MBS3900331.1 NAD(P)H-dependent glycerol-3-phosphate dehydrogenase [Dethiobacter sp.]MCL4462632.1 NAD(P)H-dependent glycerol-3-phosphate dehydrogenase [Bacillota bacterium]MCL5994027.1 NAD(P)H-dependent glycerol-3-phosphate dehydrogenase [Bacillota bacterium]